MSTEATPKNSYLLKAFFDWISDSGETPQIIVNGNAEGADVPRGFMDEDGLIVLNIALRATSNLIMDSEGVSFMARFSGKPTQVFVPTHAILGIYSRENNQSGAMFPPMEAPTAVQAAVEPESPPKSTGGLSVVK